MKGGVFLRPNERHFYCPRCDFTAVRFDNIANAPPGAVVGEFHNCKGMAGAWVPMLPDGVAGALERRERGDYVGAEVVQHDAEGKVLASVQTIRDDGEDCTVYAPCAVAGGDRVKQLLTELDREVLSPRARLIVNEALGRRN